MADYRDKLDEWREAARRKARELDEKYNIKERVEGGARAGVEAARRGAEKVSEEAQRARAEAERLAEDLDLGEVRGRAERAAAEAAKKAREAGEGFRAAGRGAADRAGDVFSGAKRNYDRAARVAGAGARAARLTSATARGASRAYDWARENPKRAVVVTLSLAGGAGAGALLPGLDAVLLGAHPHWFTHSALPVWALRKAGEKFDEYLRGREELLAAGRLEEAERERVEF